MCCISFLELIRDVLHLEMNGTIEEKMRLAAMMSTENRLK